MGERSQLVVVQGRECGFRPHAIAGRPGLLSWTAWTLVASVASMD